MAETETKVEDKVEDKSAETKVEDKTAVKTEAEVKSEVKVEDKTEKPKPWFEQRIGTLTYEKNELLRQGGTKDLRIAELENQINALKQGKTDTTQTQTGDLVPRTEVQRLAKEEAGKLAAIQVFNDKCDDVFDKGVRDYKDFQGAVDTYKELGGANPGFLSSVLEADEPHRVFYELSKDKDEAARIMSLPAVKQAAAIAKFEARLGTTTRTKTKLVSDAPAPVKDVTRKGNANGEVRLDDDNTDIRDWMRQREQDLKNARH